MKTHGQDARATPPGLNPHAEVNRREGAYLPHWTQEGAAYAATFRLCDSLPAEVLKQWVAERDELVRNARQLKRDLSETEQRRLNQLHSEKVEKWLDAGQGRCWMRDGRVAQVVATALAHFDGARYDLLAWCVMPNHVHAVVRPRVGQSLSDILHSWKSFTAKEANRLLNREGNFWQAESYDHLIRDEEDFRKQVDYVLANPAKAGLTDWPWRGFRGMGGPPMENHGQDARATGNNHGQDARATSVGNAQART